MNVKACQKCLLPYDENKPAAKCKCGGDWVVMSEEEFVREATKISHLGRNNDSDNESENDKFITKMLAESGFSPLKKKQQPDDVPVVVNLPPPQQPRIVPP